MKKKQIIIIVSGCLGLLCIVSIILFVVIKPKFDLPFIGTINGTGSKTVGGSGQPEIGKMGFYMYTSEADKDKPVTKVNVAKFGQYAAKFTAEISNTASISRVYLTLLDPNGNQVKKKDGSLFKFIPDDDGPPNFYMWNADSVKNDGIFTSEAHQELVDYKGWCSFPVGQYQFKYEVQVVSGKGLHNVTAEYPIYIDKFCD